jgi:hypothetical protein
MRRWKQIYFIGVGYILVNELLVGFKPAPKQIKRTLNKESMDQKNLISQHDTLKKAYDEAIAQNKLIFEVKGNLFGGIC